jgi:hypothetical protein
VTDSSPATNFTTVRGTGVLGPSVPTPQRQRLEVVSGSTVQSSYRCIRLQSYLSESTGFPEVASAILLRVSICTVLVTVKRLREEAYCATVDNAEFYSGVVGKNVVVMTFTYPWSH